MNIDEFTQDEYESSRQAAIDAYKAFWKSDAAEDSAEFYHLLRAAKIAYETYQGHAAKLFCFQCEQGII